MTRPKDFAARAIRTLESGETLSQDETRRLFDLLLNDRLAESREYVLGAMLSLMQSREPTMAEIRGIADSLSSHVREMRSVSVEGERVVAAVGSGKDQFKTINVTTAASLVAASCGGHIAKVGSGAESSVAGTTDVLTALGFDTTMPFDQAEDLLETWGFGFFNPEMPLPELFDLYIGRSLTFNPLENVLPLFLGIDVEHVCYGLSDPSTDRSAQLLAERGYGASTLICGATTDGEYFDELSNVGPTIVSRVTPEGKVTHEKITPRDVGCQRADPDTIKQAASLNECAADVRSVLRGEANNGKSDLVALNAGELLRICGTVDSLSVGYERARSKLDTGAPWDHFTELRKTVS